MQSITTPTKTVENQFTDYSCIAAVRRKRNKMMTKRRRKFASRPKVWAV